MSLSVEEKLVKTDAIAMVLANITAPQNESYFPKELMIAVDALSGVNKYFTYLNIAILFYIEIRIILYFFQCY